MIIDTNFAPIQSIVEVSYWLIGLTDLAVPINIPITGSSIGFHEGQQRWIPIIDLPVKLIIERSTLSVPSEKQGPKNFILHQNYFNPFNSKTKIRFTVPGIDLKSRSGETITTLKVYDLLGREIATLVNEPKQAGEYEVEFDADKYNLSSGVYLYELKSGSFKSVKKFVLMKGV